MKKNVAAANGAKERKPFYTAKVGSVTVPIYRQTNIVAKRDAGGQIMYGSPGADGKRRALAEYESDIYTVAYYQGAKRIRLRFSDFDKAKREADLAAGKLSTGEADALKLTGTDRAEYVQSVTTLHAWKPSAQLSLSVTDYVGAVKRLPENVTLKEVVDSYLKRHPIGLPRKTVREALEEMLDSKIKSGKSDVYVKDLRLRLGQFADAFKIPISTVTGTQIEEFLRAPRRARGEEGKRYTLSGRTQNNFRQQINTLFKFAIKRGYLPKDHDEIQAVELAEIAPGEIEVFTPLELRKLFGACIAPVQERGKSRDREAIIPYLAIAAFCGLRSAEIARLDWSEIHITGPEHFIEVKAAKAKTASRRTVPISDNCARWLAPFAQETGPVCPFERMDKQCFEYVAPAARVKWKRNGLRHSFISYRLAEIKNVHQVSLEAGNSPQMVFKHYRQLVTESHAAEWFAIKPAQKPGTADVVPMPTTKPAESTAAQASAPQAGAAATP